MTPLRFTAIVFCGWIVGCSPKENQSSTADTTKISSSDIGHMTTADVDVNVNQAFVAIEASALADVAESKPNGGYVPERRNGIR
jgi:hypothetical protein